MTDTVLAGPIYRPETRELDQLHNDLLTWANALVVSDAQAYLAGEQQRKTIAELRKAAEAAMKPVIEAGHKAHKAALALLADVVAPLNKADEVINAKTRAWSAEQERARREAEAAARAQAIREAEAQRLLEAERLEREGNAAAATAALEAPIYAAPVVVQSTVPKVKGMRRTVRWKWRPVDMTLIPAEYMMLVLNEKKVTAEVEAKKDAASIPGIEVYAEESLSPTGR